MVVKIKWDEKSVKYNAFIGIVSNTYKEPNCDGNFNRRYNSDIYYTFWNNGICDYGSKQSSQTEGE